MATQEFDWLNTSETASMLGVTPRTLYRFIDEGKLPAYRFGRVIRLRADEVVKFIDQCRIEPGSLGILETEVESADIEDDSTV